MENKSEAFYIAKELLMYEVDRKNDAIRYKFEIMVANNPDIAPPKFVSPPSPKKIIKMAKKIEGYLDSPEPGLLVE